MKEITFIASILAFQDLSYFIDFYDKSFKVCTFSPRQPLNQGGTIDIKFLIDSKLQILQICLTSRLQHLLAFLLTSKVHRKSI